MHSRWRPCRVEQSPAGEEAAVVWPVRAVVRRPSAYSSRSALPDVLGVAEVLEAVDRSEFDDIVEFHAAVGGAMRENGMWEIDPADHA